MGVQQFLAIGAFGLVAVSAPHAGAVVLSQYAIDQGLAAWVVADVADVGRSALTIDYRGTLWMTNGPGPDVSRIEPGLPDQGVVTDFDVPNINLDAEGITASGNFVYTIEGSQLHRMNILNPTGFTSYGSGVQASKALAPFPTAFAGGAYAGKLISGGNGSLYAVDPVTGTQTSFASNIFGDWITGIDFSLDGTRMFAVNQQDHQLFEVFADGTTQVLANLPAEKYSGLAVQPLTGNIALSTQDSLWYVHDNFSTVTELVLDDPFNSNVAPEGIVYSLDGTTLYYVASGPNDLIAIGNFPYSEPREPQPGRESGIPAPAGLPLLLASSAALWRRCR